MPATGCFEQCTNAGDAAAGANTFDALRHQYSIVAIQRNHIGNRPQSHQVQQVRDSEALLAQHFRQRRDQVESNSYPGQ